jgi:hypothetical protein
MSFSNNKPVETRFKIDSNMNQLYDRVAAGEDIKSSGRVDSAFIEDSDRDLKRKKL